MAAAANIVPRLAVAAALVFFAGAAGEAAAPGSAAAVARPRSTRRVVVSIPDCTLALIENDRVVRVFPVAVGAEASPTPRGAFQVINRITNPTYYHPGKVIPAGPSNPLGTRWIGLNVKGLGIHGTDAPESIGRAQSHGCIRMRNRDVEELFELLRPGDAVELRGENR